MITRIEAYRYRCFRKLSLALGPYHVLVGKNGAGKSTLLDIPVLLGEILAQRNLEAAFFKPTKSHSRPRADSPLELVYNKEGDWFSFAIEVLIPVEIRERLHRLRMDSATAKQRKAIKSNQGRIYDGLRYELSIRINNDALEISQETLLLLPEDRKLLDSSAEGLWGQYAEEDEYQTLRILIQREGDTVAKIKTETKRKNLPDYNVSRLTSTAPALSGMPMDLDLYAASQWFLEFLIGNVSMYAPNLELLRNAAIAPGRDWTIAPDASTLVWSIMDLQDRKDAFEEWLGLVKGALPLLTNIEAKRREDDNLGYIRAHYGPNRVVHASGLSDGTLSILALTIPAFVSNAPALMTVEEPENGIHPKAIEAVLEALHKVENSQVWVTTHSPVAVASTDLTELLCLKQTNDEGVIVTRGTDHPRLKGWKGTPSLATLQQAGVL